MMEYRGYTGVADYDPRDEIFYGHVTNVESVVTFEAVTAQKLSWEFRKAVDLYIEGLRSCEELPQPPRPRAARARKSTASHAAAAGATRRRGEPVLEEVAA